MCQERETQLRKNNNRILFDIPLEKKVIGIKWSLRQKPNHEVNRYKVRLVAKEYKQKLRIDCKEVFSPIIRIEIVKLVIALAIHH